MSQAPPAPPPVELAPSPSAPDERAVADVAAPRAEIQIEVPPADEIPDTTVVYPLELDLELVRSEVALRADGIAPLGSAATARIQGSIHAADGSGVRAEVTFAAGANLGRVLYCDRSGRFGANDLYPGLSVVTVAGPNIPGSMREVRLRQERDTHLNIGYGRPAIVHGEVFDQSSKPIAGARVTMDGQVAQTDEQGLFVFSNMASGEVLVVVEKPGYAAYRETFNVVAAQTVERGRLEYVLERGARLAVTIADRINSGEKAQLFVLPQDLLAQRKYPWFRINPTSIYPGGTVTLEDLPAGSVNLYLFHSGAVARPPVRSVTLNAGATAQETLHLEPAPVLTGTVTDGGHPVEGARVRLESPDRVRALLSVFGETNYLYLEGEVIPNLPPAVQETQTDARGEFVLSSSEEVSKSRYLVATSKDGKSTAGAVLSGGETRVDLALEPALLGDAELTIQMDGRWQPLPVKVKVNGTPREPIVLSPDKDLHVEGLTPGSWHLTARWTTDVLLERQPIEIAGEVIWPISLPEGAILGQDEDTRRRAGRR
jgi:hypothetical protein